MQKAMRYVALAVTLTVMGLIFCLSSQDGVVSGTFSNNVMNRVQNAGLQAATPGWFSANGYANVRKWAHVYIYCALGASTAVTCCLWLARHSMRCQAVSAVGACFAYAVSDEIHQYFVPGRAMLVSDVFVDAAGFVPCVLLLCLAFWLGRRYKKRSERKPKK